MRIRFQKIHPSPLKMVVKQKRTKKKSISIIFLFFSFSLLCLCCGFIVSAAISSFYIKDLENVISLRKEKEVEEMMRKTKNDFENFVNFHHSTNFFQVSRFSSELVRIGNYSLIHSEEHISASFFDEVVYFLGKSYFELLSIKFHFSVYFIFPSEKYFSFAFSSNRNLIIMDDFTNVYKTFSIVEVDSALTLTKVSNYSYTLPGDNVKWYLQSEEFKKTEVENFLCEFGDCLPYFSYISGVTKNNSIVFKTSMLYSDLSSYVESIFKETTLQGSFWILDLNTLQVISILSPGRNFTEYHPPDSNLYPHFVNEITNEIISRITETGGIEQYIHRRIIIHGSVVYTNSLTKFGISMLFVYSEPDSIDSWSNFSMMILPVFGGILNLFICISIAFTLLIAIVYIIKSFFRLGKVLESISNMKLDEDKFWKTYFYEDTLIFGKLKKIISRLRLYKSFLPNDLLSSEVDCYEKNTELKELRSQSNLLQSSAASSTSINTTSGSSDTDASFFKNKANLRKFEIAYNDVENATVVIIKKMSRDLGMSFTDVVRNVHERGKEFYGRVLDFDEKGRIVVGFGIHGKKYYGHAEQATRFAFFVHKKCFSGCNLGIVVSTGRVRYGAVGTETMKKRVYTGEALKKAQIILKYLTSKTDIVNKVIITQPTAYILKNHNHKKTDIFVLKPTDIIFDGQIAIMYDVRDYISSDITPIGANEKMEDYLNHNKSFRELKNLRTKSWEFIDQDSDEVDENMLSTKSIVVTRRENFRKSGELKEENSTMYEDIDRAFSLFLQKKGFRMFGILSDVSRKIKCFTGSDASSEKK